jgi:starvation-inducible DNA-binding protein
VDEWRELSDTVAERAVAIGISADGRAPTVIEQSRLQPVDPGPTHVPTAIRELGVRVATVNERGRERMKRLGELDLASQDVLIEVVRALEKQLWMIRAQI